MKTLAEAFHHTLQDTFCAENALIKALPKVAAAGQNPDLTALVQAHPTEPRAQIRILDKVFATIRQKPDGLNCDAIEGPIRETEGLMTEPTGVALDAAQIAAAQAVEHHETARYGTPREWVRVLGNTGARDLPGQILDKEKAGNAKFTGLAAMEVNTKKAA